MKITALRYFAGALTCLLVIVSFSHCVTVSFPGDVRCSSECLFITLQEDKIGSYAIAVVSAIAPPLAPALLTRGHSGAVPCTE